MINIDYNLACIVQDMWFLKSKFLTSEVDEDTQEEIRQYLVANRAIMEARFDACLEASDEDREKLFIKFLPNQ